MSFVGGVPLNEIPNIEALLTFLIKSFNISKTYFSFNFLEKIIQTKFHHFGDMILELLARIFTKM